MKQYFKGTYNDENETDHIRALWATAAARQQSEVQGG